MSMLKSKLALCGGAVARYHGQAVDPLAPQRAVKVTPAGAAYTDVVSVWQRWRVRASLERFSIADLRAAVAASWIRAIRPHASAPPPRWTRASPGPARARS